jgi:hypothetical protein
VSLTADAIARRVALGHTTADPETVSCDEWCRRNDVAAGAMQKTRAAFLPTNEDWDRYVAVMSPSVALEVAKALEGDPHFEVRTVHRNEGRTLVSILYLFRYPPA